MRRTIPLLLLAMLLPAVAVAKPRHEKPAAEISESIEVRLVEVDAWATGKDDQPVLDLGQSELRLTEDGHPVDILYFAQPTAEGGGVGPSTGAIEGAPVRTTLAIFFDDAHLALAHRARVATAVADTLAHHLPAATDAMLVRLDHRLEVVVPRTADKAKIVAALTALANPSAGAVEESLDEQKTVEQIRDRQRAALERQRSGGRAGNGGGTLVPEPSASDSFDVACPTELLHIADGLADRIEARAKQTLSALADFSSALAALPGRKVLLFVSDGLPTRPGGAAYDYVRALCDGSGMRAGLQYATDVTGNGPSHQQPGQLTASVLATAGESRNLANRIEEAVAQANSSGVVVWTLGAAGMRASGSGAGMDVRTAVPESASRRRGELEDALTALAVDTGGRSILGRNDVAVALGALDEDLRSSYSLAFSSPRAGDDRVHHLKLETTRPGVRLRYRQSWRDTSVEQDLVATLDGALRYGIDRPGLGARAALLRRPDGTGGLVLRVELPERSLAAVPGEDHHLHARLRLSLVLAGAGSDPTPVHSSVFPILIRDATPEPGKPALVVRDIGLPPLARPALVVVGLRDEITGTIAVLRLQVPAP